MTGDQGAELIWGIGALVLVASALVARRLPLRRTLLMALAWIAIFAIVFFGFALRGEIAHGWSRAKLALLGQQVESASGAVHIAMSADGHFWTDAEVNGTPVRFLIDSGATVTMLSRGVAERSGVSIDDKGLPMTVQTAAGISEVRRARIQSLSIGPIVRSDLAATISPDDKGDMSLLGMNFLSSMQSWRVEGQTLVLQP